MSSRPTSQLDRGATALLNRCATLRSDVRARGCQTLVALHLILLATAALLGAPVFAHAGWAPGANPASSIVAQVAFDPPAGAVLPSAALFTDEHGAIAHLTDYVRNGPAIVVPAYYSCSNLCGLVLQGLAHGLASAGLHARDLQVIVFSIAPADKPALALQKKREVLGESASLDAAGWHFLTGGEPAIEAATSALGYRYAYDAEQREYAHAAGVVVVARGGRVVRTLFGADFPAGELRAALAAAEKPEAGVRTTDALPPIRDVRTAAFTVTNASDLSSPPPPPGFARKWLLCFHYDPHTGRYSFAAMNAVRCAGLLAFFALCAYVFRARLREHRSGRL